MPRISCKRSTIIRIINKHDFLWLLLKRFKPNRKTHQCGALRLLVTSCCCCFFSCFSLLFAAAVAAWLGNNQSLPLFLALGAGELRAGIWHVFITTMTNHLVNFSFNCGSAPQRGQHFLCAFLRFESPLESDDQTKIKKKKKTHTHSQNYENQQK